MLCGRSRPLLRANVAEHPEMKRDDVFELIQSWLAAVHEPTQ
jgi:hypothetical protein